MASKSNSCMKTTSKYTFFYTTASPFSQFYPVSFKVDDVQYSCAEQFMMHQKAVLFNDEEHAELILQAHKPGQMKAFGRKVRNFDEKIWNENREKIVKKGNLGKFSQNADIKKTLLATKGTTLVEASPRDRIWGIGLSVNNPAAENKEMWKGSNLLGYIITDVRDTLLADEEDRKTTEESSGKRKKMSLEQCCS
ncbi:N-glycosidase YbiA-like [Amphiura filiformis]|uniref:N-glycosidase YbiA-like n=1 Tax=Amphiura filiformis TaxID=82378 RepID=UPI003B220712